MNPLLSEETIRAMVTLLDDTDESVINQVTNDLVAQGVSLIPKLESFWENTSNSLIQSRLESIIHHVQFCQLKADLKEWVASQTQSLFEGMILLNRYRYPNLEVSNIRLQIESMRIETWLELRYELTALEKIRILSHIIYKVHGFSGISDNLTDPTFTYLNQVLERKKGNVVSLSVLYLLIAQKLGFPIYGVDLPHHFILCYLDDRLESLHLRPEEREVLFYINPLNNGMPFERKEINEFLKLIKTQPIERYYQPCSNLDIMYRTISYLIKGYSEQNKYETVHELMELRNLLEGRHLTE